MSETSKRRTEITIETHSLTIIKLRNGKPVLVFCQICQAMTGKFAVAQAALIFRVEANRLEHLCQINSIHLADESALCGNSLADFFKHEIRYVQD